MITTPKKSMLVINQNSLEDYRVQTDLRGAVLFANDFFLHSVDIPLKKLLNQPLLSYLSVKDFEFPSSQFESLFAKSSSLQFEANLVCSKRNGILIKWTVTQVQQLNEENIGLQWLGVEINGRINEKAVHSNVDVYRSLFDNAPQPMWIYNTSDFIFLDVNGAAVCHYGYSREEFLKMTLMDIRPENEKKQFLDHFNGLEPEKAAGRTNWTHRKKDGSLIYVEIQSYNFLYYNQSARLVIVNDITEKQKAQKKLQESEERFRNMADTAPVMIWLSDENDKTTYVNKFFTDFTGIKIPEALEDEGWSEVIYSDDLHIGIDEYKKGIKEKKPLSLVYRLKCRTGEYRWVLDNAVPRFLDDGTFLGYIGSIVDIHDRKLGEEKIRFQADLIENVSDIIISTDPDFNIVTWNKIAEKTYGITAQNAIKKNIKDLVCYEYFNTTSEESFKELNEKRKWKGEVIFRKATGEPVYLFCTISSLTNGNNNVIGYVYVNSDITEKILAEKKIKKSELFYRSLIGDSLDGIALTDPSGSISFIAPSVTNILGYMPEELIRKNIFELVHPDDIPVSKEAFWKELSNDAKRESISVRIKNDKGRWVWSAIRGHNLLQKEEVQSMVIYFNDDSRRKAMEDALKESEQRFRLLSENSKDIVCLHEIDGTYLYVSPTITRLSGYLPQELMGKNPFDYFHPDDFNLKPGQSITRNLRKFTSSNMQYRFLKKDGSYLWLETTTQPIYGSNKRIISLQTTSRDISDRMQVLHELRKKEQEFRNLAENAPTIINRLDKGLHYTYCNPAFTKILGIPSEIIIGKTPQEAGLSGDSLQIFINAAKKVFKYKSIETIKIDLSGKDKGNWSFIVTIAPELDDNGEVESILAISSNITEMRQTQELLLSKEEELLQSNERFELATRASTDAIWEVNIATGYVYLTAEFTNRFGYTVEELTGKESQWYIERLHPEDRLPVISNVMQSFSAKEKLWSDEFRWRCKDGSYKYIHNRAYIFYGENKTPYKAIGAIQDITERKKAESQLIQKDILLAASAHAANELLTETNIEFGLNKSLQIVGAAAKVDRAYIFQYHYNSEKQEYYYQQHQEWNSGNYESQIDNLELQYLPENLNLEIFGRIKEGLPCDLFLKTIKHTALRKRFQGQQIKSLLLMPIFVQNNFWGFVGFDQCGYERIWTSMELDILKVFASNLAGVFERKEGERKLMESEVKFKSLFQNSLDVIYVLDKQCNIKYVTPSVAVVFGYNEEEVTGKNGFDFIHPEDVGRAKKLFDDLITNPGLHAVTDVRIKDKHGKWIWIEAKGINKFNDVIINGAIVNFHDISERKQSEQQLQGYSEHITNILNSITDGFIALDNKFNILWWNPIAEQLTGVKDVNVLGKNLWKVFPELKKTSALAECKKAIKSKTGSAFELYINKLKVYFDVNAYPSQQGLFVYFKDITHRKKQEMLLSLEKEVLELNTNPSASLRNTVDYFLEGMEKLNPGMYCSVLLLDESGRHIKHLSAPRLPVNYIKLIDGLEIGPDVGSCGTAMYMRKSVIVSDIMTDPMWKDYKAAVSEYQFKACWSFPIVSSSNTVLGSFAGYYKSVRLPSEEQLELFNRVVTLLGVIIENKQAEQKINISNERYLLATKATNDAIWDYDIKTKQLYWGESFYTLFGYKSEDQISQRGFWENKIHPDEKEKIKELYYNAEKNKNRGVVFSEYRFQKADGKYALVADRAFIVYDNNGEPARFVGSMQDVTERKKMEQQLLKQEVDKEKSIAQAVVDAQEKERAEIGKELHDNVNQILSTAKLYLELAKTDTKQRDALIKRSADSIFNAINEIRHISKALVPASVKDLGLIDSIKDLVESLHMTKAIQVKFTHKGDFENIISDKQKLMLFRIIQEQVNNVLKHAQASQLIITLKLIDKIINLSIVDNGKGFDLEKIKFKKGLGLSNIESRAHLFNGKVTITTAPQKGCKLFIEVPINNI
jgi:PAS domain S-box-containing protein